MTKAANNRDLPFRQLDDAALVTERRSPCLVGERGIPEPARPAAAPRRWWIYNLALRAGAGATPG